MKNRKKYIELISKSANSRVYAQDWYLDLVCSAGWDFFVNKNETAVMPLPFRKEPKKFFKKMLTMPPYCQQLGWFGSEIDERLVLDSIKSLQQIGLASYSFNKENSSLLKGSSELFKSRTNYELYLNNSYSELQKKYSKSTKRKLKKEDLRGSVNSDLNVNFNELIEFKREHNNFNASKKSLKRMSNLLPSLSQRNLLDVVRIKQDSELLSFAVFLVFGNRAYYIFGASSMEGKSKNASFFLFDFFIEKYSNSNLILDFEGSDIPGVEQFFSGFGAEKTTYFSLL